jgi:uncharacterized protein
MIALLDVNALIALVDTGHQFHQTVKAWMVTHSTQGWATCPLTQNGCVRIISQAGYSKPAHLQTVIEILQGICTSAHHHFWPDDLSLLSANAFDHNKIHGPRQLTDLYLLGLAVKNQGCLVTLDGAIPLSAVKGAKKQHLVVL